MGRLDAVIAGVSGSTLVGFIGLVGYAVLTAFGVLGGSAASGAPANAAAGYGAGLVDVERPVTEAPNSSPQHYARHQALVGGQPVEYLDFGTNTPLRANGEVPIAPIWVFITGFDADGSPQMVPEQSTIVDVAAGDEGYSDLWDVQFVLVPRDFESGGIRSAADLLMSGLEVMPSGMLVNCPLVPAGATTAEGHTLHDAWYRGERVHYFDMGVSTAEVGAVYEFVLDPRSLGDQQSRHLDVPPLIVEAEGTEAPSHFLLRHEVIVESEAAAREIQSVADLEAQGVTIVETPELVNRPLVEG